MWVAYVADPGFGEAILATQELMTRVAQEVLLLVPTTSYRTEDFLDAARRLGVHAWVVRDRCRRLSEFWSDESLSVEFHEPREAVASIVEAARGRSVFAIVPTDELTAVVAAHAARELGLPHNPAEAAEATRDKAVMRQKLAHGHVRQPEFRVIDLPVPNELPISFPCVLKPRHLTGSRGVMRANSPAEFVSAVSRLQAILEHPAVRKKGGALAQSFLVESYVDGFEVAVEALLTQGECKVLAIFDKPDPLTGPYFEETLYVTPSRLPEEIQHAVSIATAQAARAIGLRHGPIHAELRVGPTGPVVIEVAARTIGGLCARTLRFGTGISLEELVLRHALGERNLAPREQAAAGVMMLPVPRAGILRGVDGIAEARAVPAIESVEITARLGDWVLPAPEGAEYLGFLFARAEDPAVVENALRRAHLLLHFDIQPAQRALTGD